MFSRPWCLVKEGKEKKEQFLCRDNRQYNTQSLDVFRANEWKQLYWTLGGQIKRRLETHWPCKKKEKQKI